MYGTRYINTDEWSALHTSWKNTYNHKQKTSVNISHKTNKIAESGTKMEKECMSRSTRRKTLFQSFIEQLTHKHETTDCGFYCHDNTISWSVKQKVHWFGYILWLYYCGCIIYLFSGCLYMNINKLLPAFCRTTVYHFSEKTTSMHSHDIMTTSQWKKRQKHLW